tara:strand:- start:163 stop:546 length:384 start_codon:yes stop_codon:yes gene_type:complete
MTNLVEHFNKNILTNKTKTFKCGNVENKISGFTAFRKDLNLKIELITLADPNLIILIFFDNGSEYVILLEIIIKKISYPFFENKLARVSITLSAPPPSKEGKINAIFMNTNLPYFHFFLVEKFYGAN